MLQYIYEFTNVIFQYTVATDLSYNEVYIIPKTEQFADKPDDNNKHFEEKLFTVNDNEVIFVEACNVKLSDYVSILEFCDKYGLPTEYNDKRIVYGHDRIKLSEFYRCITTIKALVGTYENLKFKTNATTPKLLLENILTLIIGIETIENVKHVLSENPNSLLKIFSWRTD